MNPSYRVVGPPTQTGAGYISSTFETRELAQQHADEKNILKDGWEYRVIIADEKDK